MSSYHYNYFQFMHTVLRPQVIASGRSAARGTGFVWLLPLLFTSHYKYLTIQCEWLCVIMDKKYVIQCAVRRCTTKKRQKKSVPIHRFPKRGDAGRMRWKIFCIPSENKNTNYGYFWFLLITIKPRFNAKLWKCNSRSRRWY